MKHGFIKVAAATPKIKVADPFYNADRVIEQMDLAYKKGAKLVVFPELVLTGYTCNDLFLQDELIEGAFEALKKIIRHSCDMECVFFIGLPFEYDGKLYNCAAVVDNGELVAMVPKTYMPNYGEFYEERFFASANALNGQTIYIDLDEDDDSYEVEDEEYSGKIYPFKNKEEDEDSDSEICLSFEFGKVILDMSSLIKGLKVGVELCEDLWVPNPPSTEYAMNGATLIVNLSASNETVGKGSYRRELVQSTSGRLVAGYIYASAGDGESTQDIVFGGHNIIAENGSVIAEQKLFENGITYADIDIQKICHERRRMNTFNVSHKEDEFEIVEISDIDRCDTSLGRYFASKPFVPSDMAERSRRCEEIFAIQYLGLKKRLEHTNCKTAVIGVSGGLDSTLALIVTARAFDSLSLDKKGILAVTMPCFGTTDRTYNNACRLAETLGCTLMEINIKEAVNIHFRDIGQDDSVHDVTYENCQARERTQILMDLANKHNGMVIGTGDMSELALGWATYNGDHMSMYGVNVGVPKTLVRHLVSYYADICNGKELESVLRDVLDTPVSPELIPPVDGKISQKTEDIVGPYELHDFFLYYMLRYGFRPEKIYRIAKLSFRDEYDNETILKWLKI
ncbi:MAG: NAD(+) synthase, partial [Butyrivibrio sp.]|nr:NAD(+) synthase [Butyrivibrio sp.]